MIQVAIITRRLREGKTYEDFRKVWFHTTGFGTVPGGNRMYSIINAFDPREIIVIGFTDVTPEGLEEGLKIEVPFRLGHPLDDVVEPEVKRKFGLLVSEDDFSAAGEISYTPPRIGGEETDLDAFSRDLSNVAEMIARASEVRVRLRTGEK